MNMILLLQRSDILRKIIFSKKILIGWTKLVIKVIFSPCYIHIGVLIWSMTKSRKGSLLLWRAAAYKIYRKFAKGLPVFFIASIWLQWVTDFVGRYLAILNSSINFLIYCLVFPYFIITIGICVRIFDKIDRPSSV